MYTILISDNSYLENKRRFRSRLEYGKATLALVVSQNEARAEREKVKQQQLMKAEVIEESERAQAIQNMEIVWEEHGIPQIHRFILEGLVHSLEDEDLHRVCVTEITLTQDLKSTPQRVMKYYDMRYRCIEKITEINEKLIQLEEVSGDEKIAMKLNHEVHNINTGLQTIYRSSQTDFRND